MRAVLGVELVLRTEELAATYLICLRVKRKRRDVPHELVVTGTYPQVTGQHKLGGTEH